MNAQVLSDKGILKVILAGLLFLSLFLFFSFFNLFCQITFALAIQHGLINILAKGSGNVFVVQLETGINKTPAVIRPKNGNN